MRGVGDARWLGDAFDHAAVDGQAAVGVVDALVAGGGAGATVRRADAAVFGEHADAVFAAVGRGGAFVEHRVAVGAAAGIDDSAATVTAAGSEVDASAAGVGACAPVSPAVVFTAGACRACGHDRATQQ